MRTQATSKFKIDGWDEQPYLETEDGGKLTGAHVKQTFRKRHPRARRGGMANVLPAGRHGRLVGLQRVVGRVGRRSGSMVLETTRTFDGEEATAR
jgi:Protein of unknown function (DUF3224)